MKIKKRAEKRNPLLIIALIVVTLSFVVMIGVTTQHVRSEQARLTELDTQYKIETKESAELLKETHNTVVETMDEYLPGVVCWGDSLTAGAGGNGVNYPNVLKNCITENILDKYNPAHNLPSQFQYLAKEKDYSLDIDVINMGVGGETTNTILGRNGAVPFVLAEDVTIPAGTTKVEIKLVSQNGKSVAPLLQGKAGMEHASIAGNDGNITFDKTTEKYHFTKTTPSKTDINLSAGTEIEVSGWKVGREYISVIFIGQNDKDLVPSELIAKQKAMIDHQLENSDRYIIVGLHTGSEARRKELELAMENAFGNKYINLREYMSTNALSDAGISPTNTDKAQMAQGETPKSLLSDNVHFNETGYTLLGSLIYERMDELGYFDEVKTAMGLE